MTSTIFPTVEMSETAKRRLRKLIPSKKAVSEHAQELAVLDITHPEKKLFSKFTKHDYFEYYKQISKTMLPHIRDRPLSFFRFPNGASSPGFYQKERPAFFPDWVNHSKIAHKNRQIDYVVCDSKESLVYLASQVAEFHPWTSTTKNLYFPDKMIFDLDPSVLDLPAVKKTAAKLGRLLDEIGLVPFIMTTGKKGYHLAVPILPEQDNDAVRLFALKIARVIENDNPAKVTTELALQRRKDKIFIDVNRNSPEQTSIAPYSVRATPAATIALPIEWKELNSISPSDLDLKKVLRRMDTKIDPWIEFFDKQQSLKKVIRELKR